MEGIEYSINDLGGGGVRVELFHGGELVAVLYYELAKVGFKSKPIGMGRYACVDAKVYGLYDVIDCPPLQVLGYYGDRVGEYMVGKKNID